jgi:hypothetical protein
METTGGSKHRMVTSLVLVGAPLALAVLEVFHPRQEDAAGAIGEAGWFLWFHMIQLPLIGLVALAASLLTQGLTGRIVSVSRWAVAVFAVFFSAYDAAAGIATGYVLRSARGLPVESQAIIFEAAHDMPGLSLIFVISLVGTGAWVVAMLTAAVALRRAGVSRVSFVFVIMAGVFLLGGHPFPFGTLAFGCLFIAAAWMEFGSDQPATVEPPPTIKRA